MRIIAKASDSRFIVEATDEDLLRIIGHRYHRSHYNTNGPPEFKVGDQIAVHAMFERIGAIAAAQAKLDDAAKTLEAVAQICRAQGPFITSAGEPPAEPTTTP